MIDARQLVAFDTDSATALTCVLGIHAWSRTVDSVDDVPPRAFVLASRISDNMANALILGPCCFAILVLVSSRFFDSFSKSASWRSIASFAFLGSEGSPVHGGPSLAPRAVVIFFASSWKAAGNNARKVWFFSDVFVIAKIRLP